MLVSLILSTKFEDGVGTVEEALRLCWRNLANCSFKSKVAGELVFVSAVSGLVSELSAVYDILVCGICRGRKTGLKQVQA